MEKRYNAMYSEKWELEKKTGEQEKLIEKLKKERNELYKRMTGCEYGD